MNELGNYPLSVQEELNKIKRQSTTRPVIYVGYGTCGMVAGAEQTLVAVKDYISEREIDAEIVETGCIGLCSLEPIVDVQLPGKTRVSFQEVYADSVNSLLDDVFHNLIPRERVLGQYKNILLKEWEGIPFIEDIPFFALQNRIVLEHCGTISPYHIEEYIARDGYKAFLKVIRNYTPEECCHIIESSGLRGRAGGGFNTGTKWKSALFTPAEQKFLVCNAEESDPGAFMDRTIIEGDPHRLLEGIAIAAYSIGAEKAYIYIRSEYKLAIQRLEHAINQVYQLGLLGHNIFKSGVNIDIILKKGPGAFVCGEETALINSIEGKRGMPKTKPPYPSNKGLHHHPTVINNVETLANIANIIKKGPKWFKQIGTAHSKGTKVFSISGKIKYTGLVEVSMGTRLGDVVFKMAGGVPDNKEFKALHIGGPSGCIITADHLHCEIDYKSLIKIGAMMGSGGLLVLDEDTCILDMVKFFMHFMSKQSCGKCIPCREGTKRIYEILENITRKPRDEEGYNSLERFKGIMQLENLAIVMKDSSLCGLGQNAPNPVMSSLKHFKDEYDEHVYERHCTASVCIDLRHYLIDVEACTGCSVCAKKCPEDAIIGTPQNPYFIIQDKCTGCGICFDACKFNAVIEE